MQLSRKMLEIFNKTEKGHQYMYNFYFELFLWSNKLYMNFGIVWIYLVYLPFLRMNSVIFTRAPFQPY